ncbi:MAG: SDR family NAD(P)-dependent oxidoreductase [Actinomycetota bacterium]
MSGVQTETRRSLEELLDLTGKTVVVTGGAMGIGLAIAARLHEAGANVVIADRETGGAIEAADAFEERRKGSAVGYSIDVADGPSVQRLVHKTVEHFGRLDVLVNNAGIFPFVPLAQMTEEDFMRVIDVNLRGVFLCTKFAAEQMIAQGGGGKIVNVTSIDAIHPSMVGLAHYDASKHGVWGFTKNVALELAPHGISVNAIAPGGVLTPGVKAAQGDAVDVEAMARAVPMGRFADPDEVGLVALFLASDLSSYMTGSQVVVDGGMLLT